MHHPLPAYLTTLGLPALPLTYEWDESVRDSFLDEDDERNLRLAEALSHTHDAAVFALGVASTQWIAARLDGLIDLDDTLLRIDAAWALVVDPRYARLTPPALPKGLAPPALEDPRWLARKVLATAADRFSDGDDAQGHVMSLILLARHVTDGSLHFSPWLTESLRRCHACWGRADPAAAAHPVPPDAFDPGARWTITGANAAQASFVRTLDPATNPFLRSTTDMIADGFTGTPYGP